MFFFLFTLPCYCCKIIVDVGEINKSISQSVTWLDIMPFTMTPDITWHHAHMASCPHTWPDIMPSTWHLTWPDIMPTWHHAHTHDLTSCPSHDTWQSLTRNRPCWNWFSIVAHLNYGHFAVAFWSSRQKHYCVLQHLNVVIRDVETRLYSTVALKQSNH